MFYPFEYEVHLWNEIEEIEENVHGVTFGKKYTEAMANLEHYYGDDLISAKLYSLEETSVPVYEFESSQNDFHGLLKIENVSIWEGC